MLNKFVNASFKEPGEFLQLLHQSSKMTQPKTQTLMPSHVQILLYTQHMYTLYSTLCVEITQITLLLLNYKIIYQYVYIYCTR